MSYRTEESADAVVLTPGSPPDAAIVWLHGLGADGHDFVPIAAQLDLPASLAVRFVFPHAPPRPVTINNGFVMRAWYDIKGFGPGSAEDETGTRDSERVVRQYVEREIAAGIAVSRIVIAGFSQGGAMALHTGLRFPQRLAGIMALSAYLPLRDLVAAERSETNRDVPIMMCHGLHDPIVPYGLLGETSRDFLQSLGYAVQWHRYPMEHQVCMEEIGDISTWLRQRLVQ